MILPELLSQEEILKKYSTLQIWKLVEGHHLRGIFKFQDFAEALDFTVKVGGIAENMNHHPEINLSWGRVEIIIFTHDRGGLTELDIQFAHRVLELLGN